MMVDSPEPSSPPTQKVEYFRRIGLKTEKPPPEGWPREQREEKSVRARGHHFHEFFWVSMSTKKRPRAGTSLPRVPLGEHVHQKASARGDITATLTEAHPGPDIRQCRPVPCGDADLPPARFLPLFCPAVTEHEGKRACLKKRIQPENSCPTLWQRT